MPNYQVTKGSPRPDTSSFIEHLSSAENFFDGNEPIILTRAPGRLDVMGGIADYSGSLVLQLPIADATHVALQRSPSSQIRILSTGLEQRSIEIDLAELSSTTDQPIEYEDARQSFAAPERHWAAYVVGVFLVLMREKHLSTTQGARILIHSSVPEGKGVSSSAALEVAVMKAVTVAHGVEVESRELAVLCQKVENLIAGAPCGIMDQMTSACGEQNRLLELLCQPDILKGTLQIPDELDLWGIDSGVRHSVSGSDYGTVRTAAFMGYRIIANASGLRVSTIGPGKVRIDDPKWRGYLANITPAEFESKYARLLPESLRGSEFLDRYQGITDTVTAVHPNGEYPVLQATQHPVYENARVKSFASIFKNWQGKTQAYELGQLMFESHQSYSDCGLGSEATDLIASLTGDLSDEGLFGARITGGGSGGTVAVLGRRGSSTAIATLRQRFQEQTGYLPLVVSGSSPGAHHFDHLELQRNSATNSSSA